MREDRDSLMVAAGDLNFNWSLWKLVEIWMERSGW